MKSKDFDPTHNPYICTAAFCGVNEADPQDCPYHWEPVSKLSDLPKLPGRKCKHEWRQHFLIKTIGTDTGDYPCLAPDGFYCVHCLETGNTSYNIND